MRYILFVFMLVTPALAVANDLNGRQFEDWTIICTSEDQCVLEQELLRLADNKSLIRTAAVKNLERGPSLLVSVPWGVYLPHGLVAQVDDRQGRRLGFENCNPAGCHLAIPLDDKMLQELQRGLALKLQYSDIKKEPVVLQISLLGFTNGYETLQ